MKAVERISHHSAETAPIDWRKGMSDNVALALIAYTALNIFLTVGAIKETGLRSLSMVCLVILVVAIIPACRRLERRWRDISDETSHDLALRGLYRRDQALLWLLAIGLPFLLTGLFRLLA